jgi:rhodanese-related sulfurtransferase
MKIAGFTVVLAALAMLSATVNGQAQQAAQRDESRQASQAKVLKRAEIDALLAQPANVLVIDVRRPDEITSIGGFPVYLNVQAAELEKRLPSIPKDRVIITVSNHASRAGRAADLLQKNGFNVAGAAGAQDYEAEGGALVKIAPRTAAASAESRKR